MPHKSCAPIRDQINPTIMAAGTLPLALLIILFVMLALLTRRRLK
ncbi:hypothetical protein [Mesorhizobium sp. B2-6-5]|nr:hypothetical protein [Mesorhizobium sp. B2-6-5]